MAGRECYHCKQWVEEGEAHNCWTTTEEALTRDLSPDLREAWERLRETAAEFGEQRIYASLNSIMFSRQACYCFVRPKTKVLELCVFLGRSVAAPQLRRSAPASKTKIAHLFHVRHRDEVESPITDWMREAYERSDALSARAKAAGRAAPAATAKPSSNSKRKAKTATKAKRGRAATTTGRTRGGSKPTGSRSGKTATKSARTAVARKASQETTTPPTARARRMVRATKSPARRRG
jgi:hypothetical protein